MMRNIKLDEANKSKNDQQGVGALSLSVKEIRHVANTNQQKLQHLELAIANLTTICSAIRHDMYSLNSSSSYSQGSSFGKAQAEVVEMKHPSSSRSSSSPRLDSKNDMLGVQMQQLVKQAAALGIHKDSNTNSIKFSGKMKTDSKPITRALRKNVQASKNQRSSTKSLIRKESTTEKKTSMKLETVKKNNVGATQTKAKRFPEGSGVSINQKANNTNNTTNVSLKSSTVKRTKTTISKVYVNQQSAANKSNKDSTIVVKNNEETAQGKGQKFSPKNNGSTNRNSLSGAADSELRQPRKKWSTAKDINFTK